MLRADPPGHARRGRSSCSLDLPPRLKELFRRSSSTQREDARRKSPQETASRARRKPQPLSVATPTSRDGGPEKIPWADSIGRHGGKDTQLVRNERDRPVGEVRSGW